MTATAELAVSNICWGDGRDAHVAAMEALHASDVRAIDIAPGIAFDKSPADVTADDAAAFRDALRPESVPGAEPVRVAGLQAVTFGRTESIFSDDPEDRQRLRGHMVSVIRLAELVGARTIIYGSGGARLTEGLDTERVEEQALDFFGPLGRIASSSGVTLGIEPVSTTWTSGKAVFGRTAAEIVSFAQRVRSEFGEPAIKLVPDSFAMHDVGEGRAIVGRAQRLGLLAAHAQIAEPKMLEPSEGSEITATHSDLDEAYAQAFHKLPEESTLAIEMFAHKDSAGNPLAGVPLRNLLGSAIAAARHHYQQTLTADGKTEV